MTMKISELITELKYIQQEAGDLDCKILEANGHLSSIGIAYIETIDYGDIVIIEE